MPSASADANWNPPSKENNANSANGIYLLGMFTGRNNRRRGCSGVAMQSTTMSPSTIIQKPDASKCSAYVMPKKYMRKHAAMNTKLVPSEIVPSKDMNPAEIGRASCRERVCQYV